MSASLIGGSGSARAKSIAGNLEIAQILMQIKDKPRPKGVLIKLFRGQRTELTQQPKHQPRELLMTIHFLPPNSDRYDAAVEDAVATCNGDLRGALRALMLVNEQLESELVELQAALAAFGTVERRPDQSLH